MPFEYKITRRVEFSETDMAGIMHFSNFFRFMETAEHALFRSLGLSVVMSRHGSHLHLPRAHAACDYLAPLHFEDEVLVHLLVQKKGSRSLTYQFRFYKINAPEPVEVARGCLTVVSAEADGDGKFRAVALPKVLVDALQPAPTELLGAMRGTREPAKPPERGTPVPAAH